GLVPPPVCCARPLEAFYVARSLRLLLSSRGACSSWRRVSALETIDPPSPLLIALEGRAWLEFASFLAALPVLARAPRGDGHPVLVLPGWLAGDRSTQALRWFLRDRGYHVHGWKLGWNLGPREEMVRPLGPPF